VGFLTGLEPGGQAGNGYRAPMANVRPGRKIIFFLVILGALVVLGIFIIVGALNGGDGEGGDEQQQPPASSSAP
jgi:hypothetical protein